ncbi:hypothetical protein [Nocardia sp. NPDC051833]|uniref:effector-associated constant component EACC1 n=1 Tax=Nocardia sp. NPDC051833 TaxID=3155674 RepID=UPI00341A306F
MVELNFMISHADDAAAEIDSLYKNIVEDDSVLKIKKSISRAQLNADDMGAEDVIRLILEPSVTAALSACVTAWITRKSRLRIKVVGPGGMAEIDVNGHVKPSTIETVTRAIEVAVGSEASETS